MAQQTTVEWLVEELKSKGHALITTEGIFINVPNELFEQAKQMEEKQIKDAMMYALDEDGHTGDWKFKFIDEYYKSRFLHNKLDKDDTRDE